MDNKTEITQEQIDQWKEKHAVYLLTGDSKKGYIKDPFSNFLTAQQIFLALNESRTKCSWAIINNCWLGGDEALRTEEEFGNGMAEKVFKFMDFPVYSVEEQKENFVIKSGDLSVVVREATRDDICDAEMKNDADMPFMTNAYLLEEICVDNTDLEKLKMDCSRDYIGILGGVKKVKKTKDVTVKKL